MGCTSSTALVGVTYACSDIAVGGVKRVIYTHLADVSGETITAGELTAITIAAAASKELEFNNKDAFTAFTDVKSVEANGVVNSVPTLVIEFPKMTPEKRLELDNITQAGLELVIWIQTAADTYHCMGFDYGAYCSEASGASGTGRSEKNMYQVTFTGEEDKLAYAVDSTVWALVVTSLTA